VKFVLYGIGLAAMLIINGCAVVTVTTAAVDVGVAAGSMAVGAATTVAKGAVDVTETVAGKVVN
jgi:phage baseplate assembly protein gpV